MDGRAGRWRPGLGTWSLTTPMELIIDGALVEGGTDTKAPLLETATIAERAGQNFFCPAMAFELHTSRGTWPSQELETFT